MRGNRRLDFPFAIFYLPFVVARERAAQCQMKNGKWKMENGK
jgi:hypothetical protein